MRDSWPYQGLTAGLQNLVATFAPGASAGVTDGNGTLITQQRYLPFGAERTDAGAISQTELGYTGQRDLGMGLMDYHARFYSPFLGRFTQPDTITPGGPQGLNRFAYVGNNPIRYNDPSGHMRIEEMVEKRGCTDKKYCENGKPKPPRKNGENTHNDWLPDASGNNLEINILAGIAIKAQGYDGGPATVGLLYYSFGMVTDEDGGVQFYYTTKDQTYIPGSSGHGGGYLSGPAEKDYPSDAYGIGITGSHGNIYGDDFNTDKFLGKGYSKFLGVGPGSIGSFTPYDKRNNYQGVEVGLGVGGLVSMGTVATDTHGVGSRKQLPSNLIAVCRMMGQCGVTASIPPIP